MTRDCLLPHRGVEFLAKDIKIQKERIGGNFVIAKAIGSIDERDQVRKILPDCIFIILTLSKESQQERLLKRHGDGKAGVALTKLLVRFHQYFGFPQEGEHNTYNINITDDMTQTDVMRNVLDIIKNL